MIESRHRRKGKVQEERNYRNKETKRKTKR